MSEHISKAQLEVWEVRERLYQEVKGMKVKEGLHYLLQKAARVAGDLRKKWEIKTKFERSE